MKIYIKLLIIFILCFVYKLSFSQIISENAEISLLTCAPGEPLYTAFGHNAIRIKDAKQKIDYVYNYGAFNFETPNFYMKFAKGKLNYMMIVVPYKYFIYSYVEQNRWVIEQTLNLSTKQKQDIFDFLQNNAKPENMYYKYDFFFDNCATRIKDAFKYSLKEDIIFTKIDTVLTFREAISIYLGNRDWGRFGINLALGLPIDRNVVDEEITFLPDYLMFLFDGSRIIKNGKEQPIVNEKKYIFKPKVAKKIHKSVITPSILFWTLFTVGLLLTGFEIWRKKHFAWFDNILFLFSGILSIIVLMLWFFTDHQTASNNLNILWLFPLNLPAIFFISGRENIGFIEKYFLASAFLILSIVSFKDFIPQKFDIAVIPFALLIATRSIAVFLRQLKI